MAHEYRTRRRIEFVDTDMAGIVHFSRFYVLMEQAEHEFLRSLELCVHGGKDGDGNTIGWPRLAASCTFSNPAYFEDEIDIHLTIRNIGDKSLTYECNFSRGETAIARGELTAVCCRCNPGEEMKAIAIPPEIRGKLEAIPV
jgi:4-hydroxybenzoyl-CoA thioesterase/acyl-CoA thioester hydrolase